MLATKENFVAMAALSKAKRAMKDYRIQVKQIDNRLKKQMAEL